MSARAKRPVPMLPPPEPDADASSPDLAPDLAEDLEFTPVPRGTRRWNGINAIKQRAFIAHLAECGSVTMAALAIGTSTSAMYQLRKAAGAESFAQAWERAVDQGARRVLDLLMEHAIHGTPETIVKDGEVVLERRRYNHRAMQWIVAHRFPEQFGEESGIAGMRGMSHQMAKLKEKWRAEWEAEMAERTPALPPPQDGPWPAEEGEEGMSSAEVRAEFLRRYQAKVHAEREFRLAGEHVYADFSLRQLAQIELVLECSGVAYDVIKEHFHKAAHGGPWTTPFTRDLDEARRAAWAKAGEPERPALPTYRSAEAWAEGHREEDGLGEGEVTVLP